jgi:hypothetical protein
VSDQTDIITQFGAWRTRLCCSENAATINSAAALPLRQFTHQLEPSRASAVHNAGGAPDRELLLTSLRRPPHRHALLVMAVLRTP